MAEEKNSKLVYISRIMLPLFYFISITIPLSITFCKSEQVPVRALNSQILVLDELNLLFPSCLNKFGTPSTIIISRENPEYPRLNYQQNTKKGIRPLAYLAVRDARDVSNSIRCAREFNIHVAIKSGGHSYEKYSFGDNSSVVIDLGKLIKVRFDVDRKFVSAGPGITSSQLYKMTWAKGKFGVVVGLCPTIGSGLALGGGMGYFGRRFGMTLDNVLEMEVVDATGEVRTVNNQENVDWFWALRGAGGGNFGVVTSIKYKLHDFSGWKFKNIFLTYATSEFVIVFKTWLGWIRKNRHGSTFSQMVISADKIALNFMDAGLGPRDVRRLLSLFPPKRLNSTVLNQNFIQLMTVPGDPLTLVSSANGIVNASNGYFASKSYFSNRVHLLEKELHVFQAVLDRMLSSSEVSILISVYGGAINRILPDATAFVHRTSLYKIEIGVTESTPKVWNWVQHFDKGPAIFLDNGESYQNNVDGTLPDFLDRYYGLNLRKLVELKGKFDPTNFFRFPQSIHTSP